MTKANIPWSIKGVSPETRTVAKAEAQSGNMTIGDWLSEAIQAVAEAETLARQGGQRSETVSSGAPSTPSRAAPAALPPELVEAIDLIRQRLDRLEGRLGERQQPS